MSWLGIIAALFLVLLIIPLLLPFSYSLQAEIREQPSLRMTIGLGKFVGWQGRYDGGKWRSHMEFLG
ncbi:MAG: hypothetical protein ACOYD6_02180, partial [Limnochordia bacterium]